MALTFFLLMTLATLATLIVYFVERIIRKKNTTFLSVAKLFFGSAIVAFVVFIVLLFAMFYLDKIELIYILSIVAMALFVILGFMVYITRNKIRNSIAVVLLTIMGFVVSLYLYPSAHGSFGYLLNRTTKSPMKVNGKIRNFYKIRLLNKGDEEQQIKLVVHRPDFVVVSPKRIVLKPHQNTIYDVTVESNFQNMDQINIKVIATNGYKEKVQSTTFKYHP